MAACLVLLTHVGAVSGATTESAFGPFLARGDWGVAVFFVLSGFLLTRPWVTARNSSGPAPNAAKYLRRRALRILPAYWLALAGVLLLLPQTVTVFGVAKNVALMQVYSGPLLDGFFQSWSLATEAAYYAALPILAALLVRARAGHSVTALVAAACLTPVWLLLCVAWLPELMPPYAELWLPGHLDWFCAGMVLAVGESRLRAGRLPQVLVGAHRWLLAALTAFGLALTQLAGPIGWESPTTGQVLGREVLYCAAAFFLVGAALQPLAAATWWGRALESRVMVWAGSLSYAFFLWHNLVIEKLRQILGLPFGGGAFWATLVATVAVTLIVSQVSHAYVERPLMQRFGRSPAGSSPRSAPPVGRAGVAAPDSPRRGIR